MSTKNFLLLPVAALIFISIAFPVSASTTPDFGSCLNPQWPQTQQNYNSNSENGVVGVGSFAGTDSIYSSNGNVLQCLCTGQGAGYQTNWLNVSGYSNEQIDELRVQGWMYVPNGASWGLANAPYMALNSTYACTTCTPTPTLTNTPTPGPTATPTPVLTATPTPASNVQAASANNLAYTGSALLTYISLLAGFVSLIIGVTLRKLSK